MCYSKSQWHQYIFMNHKITITDHSNCKKFPKIYFHVTKSHCKNEATQLLRRRILIFCKMLKQPYDYALVCHENLSASVQTRIFGAGHLKKIIDTCHALHIILFPSFSSYWESHPNSQWNWPLATVVESYLYIPSPSTGQGQAATPARSLNAVLLYSGWRGSESQPCTRFFLNL